MLRPQERKPTHYCIQQTGCLLQPKRNCPRSWSRTGPHARRQHSFNDVTHRLLSPVLVGDRWYEKNEDHCVNPVARIEAFLAQNAEPFIRRVVRLIEAANCSKVAGLLPVASRKPMHPVPDPARPPSTLAPLLQVFSELMHERPLLAENIQGRLRIVPAIFASDDAVCNRSTSVPLAIRPKFLWAPGEAKWAIHFCSCWAMRRARLNTDWTKKTKRSDTYDENYTRQC